MVGFYLGCTSRPVCSEFVYSQRVLILQVNTSDLHVSLYKQPFGRHKSSRIVINFVEMSI